MTTWLSKWWNSYKYRFVPWIAFNVKPSTASTPSSIKTEEAFHNHHEQRPKDTIVQVPVHHLKRSEEGKLIDDARLVSMLTQYLSTCRRLDNWSHHHGNNKDLLEQVSLFNRDAMKDHLGFFVERRKSMVSPDAGTGVFAVGDVPSGSLVGLYCGTLYMPTEPLFFPSLGNKYIFRCIDGVHVDGNDRWISKSIFKSCAARDKLDFDTPCCDTSWMSPFPINPLSVGQYVNNQSHSKRNNVIYQECRVTLATEDTTDADHNNHARLGKELFRFLPNVWCDPVNCRWPLTLRLVPLIATRHISDGEELLSSYFTVIEDETMKPS